MMITLKQLFNLFKGKYGIECFNTYKSEFMTSFIFVLAISWLFIQNCSSSFIHPKRQHFQVSLYKITYHIFCS